MSPSPVHAEIFFFLASSCAGLMDAVPNTISSYVQWRRHVQSITPGFYNLSALSVMIFELWGKGVI